MSTQHTHVVLCVLRQADTVITFAMSLWHVNEMLTSSNSNEVVLDYEVYLEDATTSTCSLLNGRERRQQSANAKDSSVRVRIYSMEANSSVRAWTNPCKKEERERKKKSMQNVREAGAAVKRLALSRMCQVPEVHPVDGIPVWGCRKCHVTPFGWHAYLSCHLYIE